MTTLIPKYDLDETGSVNRPINLKFQETVSIKDFGAVGNGTADDTLAFVAMAAYVNAQESNVKVIFPPGAYVFSPQNHYSVNYAWRAAVEMVDVTNVTLSGYGATLIQNVPAGWTANDPANHYNDEGAIQFRSTTLNGCSNIVVQGLTIEMVKLAYSAGFGDGADFGIALRGVNQYIISDCVITNAATDGIYVGASYSDTYPGGNGQILNCCVDGSNRNGLSVVYNSNVQIINGKYNNSTGGSFQAGIDLEPNGVLTQSNIIINGVELTGNGIYGIATIRTTDAIISNCIFNDNERAISVQATSSYISILNNILNCTSLGIDVVGTNITDIKIENNSFIGDELIYFIRVGFAGVVGFKNYTIKNNSMVGQSGVFVGATTGYCDISGNKPDVKVVTTAGTNIFTWDIRATNNIFVNNTITIDASVTWSGTIANKFVLTNGWAENNKFISHSGAVTYMNGRTANAPVQYGFNEWSTYFYYQEVNNAAFRIKGKGTGIAFEGDGGPAAGGANGGRVVIGGATRTTNVDSYDNQVGDITYNYASTSGNPIAYRCTVAGVAGSSAGTWDTLWNKA